LPWGIINCVFGNDDLVSFGFFRLDIGVIRNRKSKGEK